MQPKFKLLWSVLGSLVVAAVLVGVLSIIPPRAATANPFAPGVSKERVALLQPTTAYPDVRITADQAEATPDSPACTACASRCLQNVGTGTCLVTVGQTSAAGTVGSIVPAGLAAGDGFGGTFCTSNTATIWIWRVGGAGTCVMNLQAEVWR
jgi:hypothetical protein